jgi:signal transduction histidine kinase
MRPPRAPWADAVLAAGLFVLGLVELATTPGQAPASVATVAVATLPLAFRRRAPLAAAAAIASWSLVDRMVGGTFDQPLSLLLGPAFAIYTLAVHAPPRRALAGGALLLGSLELPELLVGGPDYGFLALWCAFPALSGAAVRRYRERSERLAELTARLERERGASRRLAVAEERRRIARELHDAIAHAVSRMVVQAAAAEQVLDGDPDRARAALRAAQASGRAAISELRRTLGVLCAEDAPGAARAGTPLTPAVATRWRWPCWADSVLGVAVVAVIDGATLAHAPASLWLAAAVACVAIALRSRLTVPALALATAVQIGVVLTLPDDDFASLFVAMLAASYTLAARGARPQCWLAPALAMGSLCAALTLAGSPLEVATVAIFAAAATAVALPERASRRQAQRLATVAARLARERDAQARLAVLDERARLARELHDSVAHAVSVMVLQAGAAEQVLATAPGRARAAARTVEALGRQALGELRELLGVLRGDEEASPRAPQPGLAQLDGLIAQVAGTGLPVELHVAGERHPLPPGLEVSAYRIIQEALTNALKHAGPVPTHVTLAYGPEALTLEVRDHGSPARAGAAPGAGHGLVGMRERVALYRGDLETGPEAGGGYAVRARLPLEPTPA